MAQYNTVANTGNMIRGSAKIEVAPYTTGDPSWFDVGAITGLTVTENVTIGNEEFDNAEKLLSVSKQEVVISFTQLEQLNLDVHEIIRGSLDTITMESQTVKIQSGSKTTIPKFMVRLTTLNDSNGPVYHLFYKCTLNKGFEKSFQPDASENRINQNSVEILALQDSARGNFIYEIEGPFNG